MGLIGLVGVLALGLVLAPLAAEAQQSVRIDSRCDRRRRG